MPPHPVWGVGSGRIKPDLPFAARGVPRKVKSKANIPASPPHKAPSAYEAPLLAQALGAGTDESVARRLLRSTTAWSPLAAPVASSRRRPQHMSPASAVTPGGDEKTGSHLPCSPPESARSAGSPARRASPASTSHPRTESALRELVLEEEARAAREELETVRTRAATELATVQARLEAAERAATEAAAAAEAARNATPASLIAAAEAAVSLPHPLAPWQEVTLTLLELCTQSTGQLELMVEAHASSSLSFSRNAAEAAHASSTLARQDEAEARARAVEAEARTARAEAESSSRLAETERLRAELEAAAAERDALVKEVEELRRRHGWAAEQAQFQKDELAAQRAESAALREELAAVREEAERQRAAAEQAAARSRGEAAAMEAAVAHAEGARTDAVRVAEAMAQAAMDEAERAGAEEVESGHAGGHVGGARSGGGGDACNAGRVSEPAASPARRVAGEARRAPPAAPPPELAENAQLRNEVLAWREQVHALVPLPPADNTPHGKPIPTPSRIADATETSSPGRKGAAVSASRPPLLPRRAGGARHAEGDEFGEGIAALSAEMESLIQGLQNGAAPVGKVGVTRHQAGELMPAAARSPHGSLESGTQNSLGSIKVDSPSSAVDSARSWLKREIQSRDRHD